MRALYTAASGMTAQQHRLDTIANNLANVGTTGFKKSRDAFQDLFYQQLTSGGQGQDGARLELGGGVRLAGIERDQGQGGLVQTNDPLHVGIQGDQQIDVSNRPCCCGIKFCAIRLADHQDTSRIGVQPDLT